MTNATITKAIQPQIAVLRCCALQRPARAAKVLACTRWLLQREGSSATRWYAPECAKRSGAGPCGSLASEGGVIPIGSSSGDCDRVGWTAVVHIRGRATSVGFETHAR